MWFCSEGFLLPLGATAIGISFGGSYVYGCMSMVLMNSMMLALTVDSTNGVIG